MNFYYLTNYMGGVNLGIEFCSVSLFVLLLAAISIKKDPSREMHYYKCFIIGNVAALAADIIAYAVSGHQMLVPILMVTSIACYIATGYAVLNFYAYLQSHYRERYGIEYNESLLKGLYLYLGLVAVIYVSSVWTGLIYYVNEDYLFVTGRYAPVSGLMYMPLLLSSLYVSVKNRRLVGRRETKIHCGFSVLYVVLGYLDAKFLTTLHFLTAVIFAFLIYIVISLEQEQELAKKETDLVKSELNALRLQMNPHFIYNTLASIDGLCMVDPEEARNLIAKFTRHLRGSYLDNSPLTISFDKELENLEAYFAVEQVRFPDIRFETDIRVKDFEVPPLTVQPIFENAIKHGICGRDEKEGTVTLSTFEKEDCYHIVISDDGVGYDVNQKKEADGHVRLGLANTKKRLELICGGEVITTSTIGVGTTTDLVIPKKKKMLQ